MTSPVPAVVRRAGLVVAAEGVAALAAAVGVVILGDDRKLAYGTAGVVLLVGGAVLAAGWALWTGRRWGRGVAIFAQLLLLPVAWYMAVGSHRPEFGVPLGVVALAALVLLFSPTALRWASGGLERSDPGSSTGQQPAASDPAASDPAKSDSADPDTR